VPTVGRCEGALGVWRHQRLAQEEREEHAEEGGDGPAAEEARVQVGDTCDQLSRPAGPDDADDQRQRQEHPEEDELQHVGLDDRPRTSEGGIENHHAHPDEDGRHGGDLDGGIDDGPDGQCLRAEDPGTQAERQDAGEQPGTLAVVLRHDVADRVRPGVPLQPGRDEGADEQGLHREREEGEHVDVAVREGGTSISDRGPAAQESCGQTAEEDRPDDAVAGDREVIRVLDPPHRL
jgi:hypothetical protein